MAIEALNLGSELAKALVEAHREMRNPHLDTDNDYFHSRYASLPACRDAAIPVLAKHGVTVMQDLTTTTLVTPEGPLFATECRTILLHESGQGVKFGPFTLPADKPTAQSLGSAATYARRYTLNGATSLAGDVDDDGNAASAASSAREHSRPSDPCSNQPPDMQLASDPVSPQTPRPTGAFGYGKKFREMHWNLMAFKQLEWFRDQANTPRMIRDKCIAEMAWRTYELARLDALKAKQEAEVDREFTDNDIPM